MAVDGDTEIEKCSGVLFEAVWAALPGEFESRHDEPSTPKSELN